MNNIAEQITTEDEDTLASALDAAWHSNSEDGDTGDIETQSDTIAPEATGEQDPEPLAADAEIPASGKTAPVVDPDKAPNSLPPEAREVWKDAPAALKAAVAKREKDYEQGILKYAGDARRAQDMDNALRPFEQYLGMNGGVSHIGDLMRTGARLQMGSPIQKAQQIATLINQFGVDIETLDGLLSGNGAPQASQQSDIQRQINEAMQPFQTIAQSFQQREQETKNQSQARVQSEIQAFSTSPGNEFYADVRSDMADILELASRQNREMSLAEAYKRACTLHPEISGILAARNSTTDLQAKRRAASSINGTRGGSNSETPTTSVRSTLEHAWDAGNKV